MIVRSKTLRFVGSTAISLCLLCSCKKETPQVSHDAVDAKAKTAVPEDLVFNSFAGESAQQGASPGEGGAPGQGDPKTARQMKILEPGAEPRQKLRYELKPGRVETVQVKIKPHVTREASGQPTDSAEQPGIDVTYSVAAKAKGQDKATDAPVPVEAKFVKGSLIVGSDPAQKQMAAASGGAFQALTGLITNFTWGGRGVIGDVSFGSAQMPGSGAEEMLPMIAQTFKLLAVPLPDEPIGEGAKWEETTTDEQEGVKATVVSTFTLQKKSGNALTVLTQTKRSAPAQPIRDPRAPQGATVEVTGGGDYTFAVNLDGVPNKVQGETTTHLIVTDPSVNPPRKVTTHLKVAQTLEGRGEGKGKAPAPSAP